MPTWDPDRDRWGGKAPSGMPVEERVKRVQEGIENRRKKGLLPPENAALTKPEYDMPKVQRQWAQQNLTKMVEALREGDRVKYVDHAFRLRMVARVCKLPTDWLGMMAARASIHAADGDMEQEPLYRGVAKAWLREALCGSTKFK